MLTKGQSRQEFTLSEAEAGQRLDRVLAARLGLPRSAVQCLFSQGRVTAAGRRLKPASRLAAGAVVVVDIPSPPAELPRVPILHEDEHIVVVDKPAGLPVHPPGAGWPGVSLVEVLSRDRRLAGGAPERPGVVHRLDAATSGVMVVAKDHSAYLRLVEEFRSRRVLKEYLALVEGELEVAEGEIRGRLGRDPRAPWRMRVSPGGKDALTEFRVLRVKGGRTLLSVRLHTGRTHQIRVHLAAIGHPVVGDPVYGRAGPRLMLHSFRLGFYHPRDGKWREFTSRPPAELAG